MCRTCGRNNEQSFRTFKARDNNGREYLVGYTVTELREGKKVLGYKHQYTLPNGMELQWVEKGVAVDAYGNKLRSPQFMFRNSN
jgi:hypothetical protein